MIKTKEEVFFMERVMTVEEKIRRAEEIYERRKQGETRPVTKVTVNDKKDIKLLKKMIIQILICVSIYLVVYTIQNRQYVFSEDFIHKVDEILSYDTNFIELYENIINFTKQEKEVNIDTNQETNSDTNSEENADTNSDKKTEGVSSNQAIGGAEEVQEQSQNANIEGNDDSNPSIENLSQAELDVQNIKNTTAFIKPVEGIISSKYGQRDTATRNSP